MVAIRFTLSSYATTHLRHGRRPNLGIPHFQRLQPLLLPHRQRLLLLTRLTIAPALHVFRGMASIVRTHMMP